MATFIQHTELQKKSSNYFFLIRLILFVLIAGLCVFELFLNFRGLEAPAAMDQAQIARQIARGEGFTTKFFRPLDVSTQDSKLGKKKSPDFNHFKETNYAPLHAYALSAAIKAGEFDKFDKNRMDSEISNVYAGDRWVAGVSMVFFLIALILAYFLFTKLFDEVLACSVVAFMSLSELMLQYAVSGLAQPMMMALTLGIACLLGGAVHAQERYRNGQVTAYLCGAFVLAAVMCMSNFLCIWPAIGLLIFCACYFRPIGLHAGLGTVILAAGAVLPIHLLLQPTGGILPHVMHAIFFSFGSDTGDLLLRATSDAEVTFNSTDFFLRLLGYTFGQWGTLFHDMGGIIVTPFFFLALFNKYKRRSVEAVKWAVFAMWLCSSVGMALFSEAGDVSPTQLAIVFTPFFTAYGLSLVFNFLARLQLGVHFRAYRALAIFTLLLISSGAFLFELPVKLHIGILTSARGVPHYPPYYPPALNGKLYDITNANDVIVTDQPWAVAWYADRKALWMPTSVDDYTRDMEAVFEKSQQGVQGFLITPTSHSMPAGGVAGVVKQAGDFAPLALEGKLLILSPKHNMAFAELFNAESQNSTKPLASLVSSQGKFAHRNFLLGAEMIYYSKDEVQQPAEAK